MASLAGLLQLQGHRITGSDKAAYPPMSDLLRSLGIPILEPYSENNLDPVPDLVVVGNALSRGNPEIERVLDDRIPFTSMAALLREEFLSGRESLVVAGTHGKTTTTSMLAWIYQVAALKDPALEPSFLIGGVAENFASSFQLRPTSNFIVEGDEYDTAFFDKGPKFLHYFPAALILTHVEFDHADIYSDLEFIKTAFKRLVNLVPRRGLIVAYDGSPNVTECVSHALCPVERYGFTDAANWRIQNLRYESGRMHWEVFRAGFAWANFNMDLRRRAQRPERNRCCRPRRRRRHSHCCNRRSSRHLQKRQAPSRGPRAESTASPSSKISLTTPRPFARLFGHCAPSIPADVCGLCSSRAQTHSAAKCLANDLVESLSLADRVILAAVFQQERIPEQERLHPEEVVRALNAAGTQAELLADADAIVAAITPQLAPHDVVAILSNGGFDGIYDKLPARLRERFPAAT